jgi:hypothetical protein
MEKEKIEIQGIVLEEKSEEEAEESIWNIVDIELSREVEKKLQGIYEEEFVYNIPYWTAPDKGGKVDWGILCEKINCKYRREGKTHTHVLGINVNGADQLMRTYKHFNLESEKPEIMDIENKKYWMIKMTVTNIKDKITKPLWVIQAVMQSDKTGKYTFNENALAIAQSKGFRNLILSVVPSNAKVQWIKEYSEGKAYTKPEELPNATNTTEPTEPANNPTETSSMVNKLLEGMAEMTTIEELSNFWNDHEKDRKAFSDDDKILYSGAYKKFMDKLKVPKDSLI